MSIFPTKILLATDGSKEARLALTRPPRMLAPRTPSSEVHVALRVPSTSELRGPFPNPITRRRHALRSSSRARGSHAAGSAIPRPAGQIGSSKSGGKRG